MKQAVANKILEALIVLREDMARMESISIREENSDKITKASFAYKVAYLRACGTYETCRDLLNGNKTTEPEDDDEEEDSDLCPRCGFTPDKEIDIRSKIKD